MRDEDAIDELRVKRNEHIVLSAIAGRTGRSIGKDWGISRARVWQILKAKGIKSTNADHLSDDEKRDIVTLYEGGATVPLIIEATGRSSTTVKNALASAGVYVREDRAPEWSSKDTAYLRQWWPYSSASQIGRELGKTRNAVIGRARRMGLSK